MENNKEEDRVQQLETSDSSLHNGMNRPYRMTWRTYSALISLALAFSVAAFASAGPASCILFQAASFPDDAQNASWIANAPLFPNIAFSPIVGTLSDRYGKKWFVVGGCILGVIGSAIAGSATSLNMLIGGQTITGAGIAGVVISFAGAMEIVAAKNRPAAMGLVELFNGILGPTMGVITFALCISFDVGGVGEGWRWGYRIQAILYGVYGIFVLFSYNPPPAELRRLHKAKEVLKTIDFIGLSIFIAGLIIFILPLVQGGTSYAWNSARIISMLVVGILTLVVFGLYEWFKKSNVLVDHAFFENRNFAVLCLIGFIDGMVLYGVSTFLPEQLGEVYDASAIEIGVYLLPYNLVLAITGFVGGIVVTRLRKMRWLLVSTVSILALFLGLSAIAQPDTEATLIGLGAGVGFGSAVTLVIPVAGIANSVPSHLIGTSLSLLSVLRSVGGVVGITIFASVYGNKFGTFLPAYVASAATNAGLPSSSLPAVFLALSGTSTITLASIPGMTPNIIEIVSASYKQAASDSFRYVWLTIMAVTIAGAISAIFIREVTERMTNFVESALEKNNIRQTQKHAA